MTPATYYVSSECLFLISDIIHFLDANKTIAPDYTVDWPFFDIMVKDHINQYNYTLNPIGIFNSIKFMYTYYPDPNNKTHIREEFVRVRIDSAESMFSTNHLNF